jgi:YHS domain-containing protein
MSHEIPSAPHTEAETELEVDTDIDPVCGERVEPEEAATHSLMVEYEGRQYVFCGKDCRARFEHAPTRYAAAGRAQP